MEFITTGNRIAVENFTLGDLYTITFTNGTYINSACIGIGENFVSFQRNEPELLFSLTMETAELVSSIELYAGGTTDYNDLTNKPQINDVELVGNKSLSALGIQPEITEESPLSSSLVSGLGSAAAADTTDFATAAQGALAASAVQPATMEAALALKQDALSTAQLAAVNSGITSSDVAQITTNKNNISKQQDTTEQGGSGYAIINGQRLYMGSETQPPIPPQSIWLYNGVKIKSINYFDTDNYVLVPVSSTAERSGTNCGILPAGQYTLSATVSTSHSQLYRTIKNGDNYTLDTILSLPYTFTADGISEQIIRVAGADKNSWSEEGYSNIMLNTGDTAETYIDYWT